MAPEYYAERGDCSLSARNNSYAVESHGISQEQSLLLTIFEFVKGNEGLDGDLAMSVAEHAISHLVFYEQESFWSAF